MTTSLSLTSFSRAVVRIVAGTVAALTVVTVAPGVASAHNELVSTDPADGAVLDVAPTSIAFTFSAEVPLTSATVTVIDPAGVRTDVPDLTHGATTSVLVAPLPALPAGEVTVRWRLVSEDGHPLTGRVVFTIPASATTLGSGEPSVAPSTSGTVAPTIASTVPVADVAGSDDVDGTVAVPAGGDDAGGTPGAIRWVLRYGSYLAIMLVVAVVLTDRWVWPGVAQRAPFTAIVDASLLAVVVLAALQLLVLASDFSGSSPWSAFGDLDRALQTDAGFGLALRMLLAAVVWLVLMRMTIVSEQVRWTAIGGAGILLLGTWAWAGHAKSQRWPELGVPIDIIHHAAAALWIGALAIVGVVAMRVLDAEARAQVLGRLSATAMVAVVVIVVTGAAQTVRLVGSPFNLLDAAHGRYLIAKLVVLAAMLALAASNRRRLAAPTSRPGGMSDATAALMRRSVVAETALGLVVIAITASMVVASPAAPRDDVTVVSGVAPATDR